MTSNLSFTVDLEQVQFNLFLLNQQFLVGERNTAKRPFKQEQNDVQPRS